MNPEHKKYILENMDKKSAARIASELGIRERKVKRIIGMEGQTKKPAGTTAPSEKKASAQQVPVKKIVILASIALIIIMGFAVYTNSLNGQFVFDDDNLIRNNILIKDWSGLSRLFAGDIGKGAGRIYPFYRPIQMATYALDYHIWKSNVVGYHLTNILLHILAALAIYYLINIFFEDRTISVLTGLFFVIHPVHTIVVSYISTRAESLCLLFMIVSFIFYIKSSKINNPILYIIMILSYSLSLLSKENALILPVLLLLYHYTFREKVRLKEFLSISGAALIYILLRITILKSSIAHVACNSTLFQRIPGFFVAIASYIRLMFLPFDLHLEYGGNLFNLTDPRAITGLAVLAGFLFFTFRTRKTNGFIFFSLSWFLITLLPVSNLYPLNAYMSENWLYLPSIGFFLLISGFLSSLYRKKAFQIFALALIVCLAAYYSYLTIRQNKTWQNPITFYERTLKYVPGSARMHINLGAEYDRAGRREEALAMYKKAIELDPNASAEAYYNLGLAYYEKGRKEDAVAMYKKALELKPYAEMYNNIGVTYSDLGRLEEAVAAFKKALEMNPNLPDARRNLAMLTMGPEEQVSFYKKILEVDPYDPKSYNSLGLIYYKTGRKEEAVAMYKKGLELNPNYAELYNNLGVAYSDLGRRDEAIAAFKKALEINPDSPNARRNLEVVSGGSKQKAPK